MPSQRTSLIILNILHIIIGLLSLIFALIQFSASALDNASLIDFRLLNIIHSMTGSVGLHMICKNFGSVVPKTLYCLSFVLSLWTFAFYSDTLAQEASQFESMREIRKLDGGQELVTDETVRNHAGKLAVCSIMILLSLIEIGISAASVVVLERMNNETSNPKIYTKPIISSSDRRRRQQMAFVALMKIACSLATIGLGSYLEALYKRRTAFVKIGWHILAGTITFLAACIDLRALYAGRGWNILNLKVSLILSIASAVVSIKTLDYSMSNYFVADVREYSRFDELRMELQTALQGVQVNAEGDKREAFVKFVVHAAVIGSLALSFAHSVISAVEAGSYIEKTGGSKSKTPSTKISTLDNPRIYGSSALVPASNFRFHPSSGYRMNEDNESDELNSFVEYDETLHKRKTCSGIFQCVCGLALISLCVISLVTWDFSRGYDGGVGVLWLGCLFIASGLVNANRPKTFTTSVYVLSVISCVLSFERSMYSLNVIYQAARNPRFQAELDPLPSDPKSQQSNHNAHTGRITLYAVETCVLFINFVSSAWTCYNFTSSIKALPRSTFAGSKSMAAKSKGALCSLGFFHLLYAFVTIAVSIAAEVALWSYNVHVSYLVYSTNGIVVFAAVFVQWLSSQHFQFLIASAVMNAVTASIAFFVMAPAVRDLYTLVAGYRSVYEGSTLAKDIAASEILDAELRAKPVQEWVIGMNALIVFLSITEYCVSIISGMICSYLLHHANENRNASSSDLRFPTLTNRFPWPNIDRASNGNGAYRRSCSVSSSLAAGFDHYPTQSTKQVGISDLGYDDYPLARSSRTLNRVIFPPVNGSGMQKAGSQFSNGHYGSVPASANARNGYGSIDRYGQNRSVYY